MLKITPQLHHEFSATLGLTERELILLYDIGKYGNAASDKIAAMSTDINVKEVRELFSRLTEESRQALNAFNKARMIIKDPSLVVAREDAEKNIIKIG